MSSVISMRTRRYYTMAPIIHVHIVEDHDEALHHVYRAIGSKKLPFSGTGLVHFDSHPDLLSPNLQADDFYDKEKLFAYTSIAEWILPAIYVGHVDWVVWIKPPWALQIDEGTHDLTVGKDVASGHVRVSTPLPYYISELLCVPLANLQNARTVPLHVVTIGSCNCSDSSLLLPTFLNDKAVGMVCNHGDDSSPEQCSTGLPSKRAKLASGTDSAEGCCQATALDSRMNTPIQLSRVHSTGTTCVSDVTRAAAAANPICLLKCTDITVPKCGVTILKAALENCSGWWLDIDLDFFSTANPFKSVFSKEQFEYMDSLYALKRPDDPSSPESIAESVWNRQIQLFSLNLLLSRRPAYQSTASEKFMNICALIGTSDTSGSVIDGESLHLAGMMTDLPHHVSNVTDLTNMAASMYHLLHLCWERDPSIVTIARSTQDDYTPSTQVDCVQLLVVRLLEELCVHTDLRYHYHYLGTPEHKRRQSPDACSDDDDDDVTTSGTDCSW